MGVPYARYRWILIAGLFLILWNPATAGGHAFPERADPRVGSEGGAPSEVKIWFDGPLESLFSTLKIFDEAGVRVDQNNSHVDLKEPTLLRASVVPLPPGRYRVSWGVLARDGHRTEGEFTFRVK